MKSKNNTINSIIWSPSSFKILSEAVWKTFKHPIILTTIKLDWIEGFYRVKNPHEDYYYPFEKYLSKNPDYDVLWTLDVNSIDTSTYNSRYIYENEWKLIKPNNFETFIDLVHIIYELDFMYVFSGDVDIRFLSTYLSQRIKESFAAKNQLYFIDEDFIKDTALLNKISESCLLQYFLYEHDCVDYTIYSNNKVALKNIMNIATKFGEPKIKNFTDSFDFKKSFNDTVIFFTDIDLIIKNRLG